MIEDEPKKLIIRYKTVNIYLYLNQGIYHAKSEFEDIDVTDETLNGIKKKIDQRFNCIINKESVLVPISKGILKRIIKSFRERHLYYGEDWTITEFKNLGEELSKYIQE